MKIVLSAKCCGKSSQNKYIDLDISIGDPLLKKELYELWLEKHKDEDIIVVVNMGSFLKLDPIWKNYVWKAILPVDIDNRVELLKERKRREKDKIKRKIYSDNLRYFFSLLY